MFETIRGMNLKEEVDMINQKISIPWSIIVFLILISSHSLTSMTVGAQNGGSSSDDEFDMGPPVAIMIFCGINKIYDLLR